MMGGKSAKDPPHLIFPCFVGISLSICADHGHNRTIPTQE